MSDGGEGKKGATMAEKAMAKLFGSGKLMKMLENRASIDEIRDVLDKGALASDIDQSVLFLESPGAARQKCSLMWLAAMGNRWDVAEELVRRGAKADLPLAMVRASATGGAGFVRFIASRSDQSPWGMGAPAAFSGMEFYPAGPGDMYPPQAALWEARDDALVILVDDAQSRLDRQGKGSQRAWTSLINSPTMLFDTAAAALGNVPLARAQPMMEMLERKRVRMEASVTMLKERDMTLDPAKRAARVAPVAPAPAPEPGPIEFVSPQAAPAASPVAAPPPPSSAPIPPAQAGERPKRAAGVAASSNKLAERRDQARAAMSELGKSKGPQ